MKAPILQSFSKRKKILIEDFEFFMPDGEKITIKKGFVTDLASVPRQTIKIGIVILYFISWVFMIFDFYVSSFLISSFAGFWMVVLFFTERCLNDEGAFVAHDFLYQNKKLLKKYSRKDFDICLIKLMEKYKSDFFRVLFVWLGVRLFGRFFIK